MRAELHDLAGEFALGLLDGSDRDEAARLQSTDPEFWAAVAMWRARLAPLLDEVEPVAAPPSLWVRIDRAIGAANDNRRGSGSAAPWRWATGAMTLLAAALAALLFLQPALLQPPTTLPPPIAPTQPAKAPPMVAMIGADGATKVVANWEPASSRLVLAVAGPMPADSGQAHELWIIPKGGDPRSLGTVPDRKMMAMNLADTLSRLIDEGATIAISVEPMGGSKTGKPTGPVIASGTFENI